MDAVKAIKCYCASNPDFNGSWNASDIKQELKDLGDIPENEWMEYLFGHIFNDYNDWTSELEHVVVSDTVKDITLKIDNHMVVIKKFYYTEF